MVECARPQSSSFFWAAVDSRRRRFSNAGGAVDGSPPGAPIDGDGSVIRRSGPIVFRSKARPQASHEASAETAGAGGGRLRARNVQTGRPVIFRSKAQESRPWHQQPWHLQEETQDVRFFFWATVDSRRWRFSNAGGAVDGSPPVGVGVGA